MIWVLGIQDGYAGCRQTCVVEEGKDEGSVGTERGRNTRAGCMGGGRRALGGTKRMGRDKTSSGWSGTRETLGGCKPSGRGLPPPNLNPVFADVRLAHNINPLINNLFSQIHTKSFFDTPTSLNVEH